MRSSAQRIASARVSAMPAMISVSRETLSTLTLPFLRAFSEGEVFTKPMAAAMEEQIPGARGRTHPVIPGAGHLIQEEAAAALADVAVGFFRQN
jgi:pimeloyl-ACP methyl ester carboxylesterase